MRTTCRYFALSVSRFVRSRSCSRDSKGRSCASSNITMLFFPVLKFCSRWTLMRSKSSLMEALGSVLMWNPPQISARSCCGSSLVL